MTEEIIIDGVNVSEWTDEEIRYNFEKHSPKAIRQIAFDLYKQLKRAENLITNPESKILDSIKRAKIKTDIGKAIEELFDNE